MNHLSDFHSFTIYIVPKYTVLFKFTNILSNDGTCAKMYDVFEEQYTENDYTKGIFEKKYIRGQHLSSYSLIH